MIFDSKKKKIEKSLDKISEEYNYLKVLLQNRIEEEQKSSNCFQLLEKGLNDRDSKSISRKKLSIDNTLNKLNNEIGTQLLKLSSSVNSIDLLKGFLNSGEISSKFITYCAINDINPEKLSILKEIKKKMIWQSK